MTPWSVKWTPKHLGGLPARDAKLATALESMPPLKKEPTGTSCHSVVH